MKTDKKTILELQENGYCVFEKRFEIPDELSLIAKSLTTDKSYKVGASYKTNIPEQIDSRLLQLVKNEKIEGVFKDFNNLIRCQDIFITHEYKNTTMERNNWLHFDRLRCLKAMVYLSDVEEGCGALSIVPGSHTKGAELRRGFQEMNSYEDKRNRIELDYPELMSEPVEICAPSGTLILFDTDAFHKGGDVASDKERLIIRSHWYVDMSWRIGS